MKFAYVNFGFLRKRGKLYIVIIVLSIHLRLGSGPRSVIVPMCMC